MNPEIIILGGGPAGLAAAFYAHQNKKSFLLIEKNPTLGGNAVTFTHENFLYDSGAHRWHNVYPDITKDVRDLLGEELREIRVPSSIAFGEKNIRFPLEPLDLFKQMNMRELLPMITDFMRRKTVTFREGSFAHSTQQKYGTSVCQKFLWDYTEKLWGEDSQRLSQEISGQRLKGLDLKTFFSKQEEHLDGKFYYPARGIGQIFDKIRSRLSPENILLSTPVEGLETGARRIKRIRIKGQIIECENSLVINTLSAPITARMLGLPDPDLRFRKLGLVFFPIRKPRLSPFASVYLPEKTIPFTRMVEPRNRSALMAPSGQTSLVLELPHGDVAPVSPEETGRAFVRDFYRLKAEEVGRGVVHDLENAYPILTLESLERRKKFFASCAEFENLFSLGRNATFSYLHLHDLFKGARDRIQAVKLK